QRRLSSWSAKIRPCELFYCRERLRETIADELIEAYVNAGAEPLAVSERVIDAISRREASQGAAATLALSPMEWTLKEIERRADESTAAKLVAVLDRPQNPGNVGALIRTADAVGALAVVMLEPCADPFDPKAVRSSMGSLFSVPVARLQDPAVLSKWLAEIGCRFVGADGAADRVVWDSDRFDGSVALALGSEADGLSDAIRRKLEASVGLPLHGGAESLNMAVAGGILMYEWLRVHRGDKAAKAAAPPADDFRDCGSEDKACRG
nr:RNA methyltransferase [Candidatus Bipolaricaulota bacterium]